jgi:hypothetical protein
MPQHAVISLFLFLLALAPSKATAHVHRRSVGPVILDLGPLPPAAPLSAGDPGSGPTSLDNQSAQQVEPPARTQQPSPPQATAPIFPAHAQILGPLVLTFNTPIIRMTESSILSLSPTYATLAPVLVAYYHPTLAEDLALLNPAVEAPLDPAIAKSNPAPDPAAPAVKDTSLPRLRGLLLWIGRLLFLIGLGALIMLFRRYRARSGNPASLSPALDALSDPQLGQDIVSPRALRTTRAMPRAAADSLSLMNQKPTAIDTPKTGSTTFDLIEPGAASPVSNTKERQPVREGPESRSTV